MDEVALPPQVIVNGMRVRVRLDQQRLGSLLQGLSPHALGSQFAEVTSGMLSMLGDMASLSFAPYTPGHLPPALPHLTAPWCRSTWACTLLLMTLQHKEGTQLCARGMTVSVLTKASHCHAITRHVMWCC